MTKHYQYKDLLTTVLTWTVQYETLDEDLNIALHQLKDALERYQPQETVSAYARQAMLLAGKIEYASLQKYLKRYLREQAL